MARYGFYKNGFINNIGNWFHFHNRLNVSHKLNGSQYNVLIVSGIGVWQTDRRLRLLWAGVDVCRNFFCVD